MKPVAIRMMVAAAVWVAVAAPGARTQPAGAQPPVAEAPRDREAVIWYLYHSGWAVRTQHHLLVFDYAEPSPPPTRALSSGSIDPAEIAGLRVTVFVSHAHGDHFDPVILGWRETVKSIRYVWGWTEGRPPGDLAFGSQRQVVTVGGMRIANVHHAFDGIPESAFLVDVDGVTLIHAGDHGHSRGAADPVFKDNLTYLRRLAPRLDLFFTPTFGGELDAIAVLRPRVVLPMHDGGTERQYRVFAGRLVKQGIRTAVGVADRPGACFRYRDGSLSPLLARDATGR